MVNEPGDWQWSSYLVTIGKQGGFEGLATDAILLQFGKQRNRAIERFQLFISEGKWQEIWRDLKHQIYLGDKDFVEKHRVCLANQEGKLSEDPLKQRRKPAKKLKEYLEGNTSRNDVVVAAYRSDSYAMDKMAKYFGCHYSTVSRMAAKNKT